MRKIFAAGNWKMNKNIQESIELVKQLSETIDNDIDRDILVCPPFTSLFPVYEIIKETKIKLGSQNIFWEEKGAFTAEISADMLKSAGCEYSIIGHSERRQYFNETDETVNKRVKITLSSGLKPIICVGETLEQRENNVTEKIIETQIRGAFKEIPESDCENITIAYEPIWAIGTGKTATPDDANNVHKFIRNLIKELYNDRIAENMRILYGGSVKPGNAAELFAMEDIDGGLIGGAALNAEDFIAIYNAGI